MAMSLLLLAGSLAFHAPLRPHSAPLLRQAGRTRYIVAAFLYVDGEDGEGGAAAPRPPAAPLSFAPSAGFSFGFS